MAYEKKDMSGTLFRNDKREKDTHPHAQGTAIIDGIEYWISAWTKDGAKGKFQSLAFKRKESAVSQIKERHESDSYGNQPANFDDMDTIPFEMPWK